MTLNANAPELQADGQQASLSLVMPAFNEEAVVEQSIRRVLDLPFVHEVVFVDDGSTDRTLQIVQAIAHPRLKVFALPRNRGKGSAVRFGFSRATGQFVAIQDADLEYDPRDLEKLLVPLLDGRADVVFGSRFRTGSENRVLFYWHSLGNKLLTTLSNLTTNLNLTDMETGYKVFRREVAQRIVLEEEGFGMEPEITAKMAAMNVRVYEVGISYSGRTYEEGKKIGWRDGVHALRAIAKYGVASKRDIRRERGANNFAAADEELDATLESLSASGNYNTWIADLIAPHLGADVLEVGAGQGSITRLIAARGHHVTALEPSVRQAIALRESTADNPNVTVIEGVVSDLDDSVLFDSVYLVNVMEHIEDDVTFLRDVAAKCRPGGRVMVWVPAVHTLYSDFDRRIGHYRRYAKPRLRVLAELAGLEPESIEYVNAMGVPAWFIGTKLLGITPANADASAFYDQQVVPKLRKVEERLRIPLGQSLLMVATMRGLPEAYVATAPSD